jgi:hypothetical protein
MININLLPKKRPFEKWYSFVLLGVVFFLTLVSLSTFYLIEMSVREHNDHVNTLSQLQNKERVYTEMTEKKRYVFGLRQLKEDASLLQKESTDWLPLLQTLFGQLPIGGALDTASFDNGEVVLTVRMKSREGVAGYSGSLRSSPLFEDVFVLVMDSNELGEITAQLVAKPSPSILKGGQTQ